MSHPNVDVLRMSDEAMTAGDIEKFLSYFTDDVVMHVGGRSSLAGTYKGKDQFQEAFGRFMELAGDYSFEPHAYLADDEHGVIMQRSKLAKADKTLEMHEVFVMHFTEGKISEMWYLPSNQAGVDAWLG